MLASAPGRINILGNPTDALEGAYAVISSAIKLRAYIEIKKSKTLLKSITNPNLKNLFKNCIKAIQEYFPAYYEEIIKNPTDITNIKTEIPKESGLSGSTALMVAFMKGLKELYKFNKKLNDYILAELVQRAEEKAGITCGYADRYVCTLGGLAYIDFRGKLYHKPLYKEPLATYERLDYYVKYIPLLIAYLGIPRSSGQIHKKFRKAYMKELLLVKSKKLEKSKAKILKAMKKVGLTAMYGKYALLEEDWEKFGKLMNQNHKWVNYAMKLAGFKEGAGYYNNAVINYALKEGALGAKLSGAGGGGSVIILVEPGKENSMKEKLEKYMKKIGLKNSKVYFFNISKEGARIENNL